MSTLLSKLLFGSNNQVSGLIALTVVAMIALGCTCGKNFDFANLGTNSNSNSASIESSSDDTDADEKLPSKELLDAIIAETTADFNYAITLNDFSKMYEKASLDFQNTYTEDGVQRQL